MVSVSRRLVFLTAAALLTASGIFTLGIQAERATQTAPSSTISAAVLKALQWRSVGPPRAGRTIAVSGVKGRPKEAYTGQTGGGLWKTVDGGETWAPVTDGKINSSSVGAVAVSESNPDVVFIGMGESCIRGNIQPGDGVYKSTDAGKTWTHVGFSDSQAISKIRIHPTNPDIVYVASFGKYGVPSDERGIFKSTDGGKTLEEDAVPRQQDRRRRHRDRSAQPERHLRGVVGGVPRRVPDVERRAGQRPLQVDRRRRDLDRDHPPSWPADDGDRQDRRRGLGRGLEPRLRDRRGRERRAVQLRRCAGRRGSW